MNTFGNSNSEIGNMDYVGRLIKLAGARETVPGERLERSRQKVRTHWEQVVAEQQSDGRPRRFNIIAMAASVAVAAVLVIVLWKLPTVPPYDELASVDRVLGKVLIAGELAGKSTMIKAGEPIVTGSDSRIALRMSGGQSLRIDTASHVIVHSPNLLSLEAGAVYIDTEFASSAAPIVVSTPLGTAQDIGTQFQVRLMDKIMFVGVRQGLVEVLRDGKQSLSLQRGYSVELDAEGESEERIMPMGDPAWEWIETVAPEFEIEGASLEQYLKWYVRERGVALVWADEASKANARAAILSGSIAGTSLDDGLQIVERIAPFKQRLSDDTLWVKVE